MVDPFVPVENPGTVHIEALAAAFADPRPGRTFVLRK